MWVRKSHQIKRAKLNSGDISGLGT